MEDIDIREIRETTQESLRGPAIAPFVTAINQAIRRAAKEGRSVIDPWGHIASLRGCSPSHDEREAIEAYYAAKGFSIKDHPDPDPGHPASRPYTTLSW